ncbi:hypothetical protein B0H19DRAFT_901178, partial [Mycena capillaripes]
LNSNEIPLDSDIETIESAISRTDTTLARLDDEIVRLQERLQQLEEKRASLAGYRVQNFSILSPLRRTPPEVLSEIFSWTLPPAIYSRQRMGFSAMDSPWVLTHICRRWRAVAISTPPLWSL